jgi:hypothetical protein
VFSTEYYCWNIELSETVKESKIDRKKRCENDENYKYFLKTLHFVFLNNLLTVKTKNKQKAHVDKLH